MCDCRISLQDDAGTSLVDPSESVSLWNGVQYIVLCCVCVCVRVNLFENMFLCAVYEVSYLKGVHFPLLQIHTVSVCC